MKKFLALTLVLVTCLSLFAGCGKSEGVVLPKIQIEDTLENRQAAIVELALAYYYKNPYNQYDNIAISSAGNISGRRGTVDYRNTPEYASADMTMYNVCTSYAYHVIFGAMGFRLLESARECLTKDLVMKDGAPESMMLLQHERSENMQENIDAMNQLMSMLQPGDVVTYVGNSGSGHTVIYCGDLDGDGKGDILHCNGKKYDMSTGLDETEDDGAILLNHSKAPSAEAFLAGEDFVEYLPKKLRFNLIRPALLDTKEYPLTDSVKTRLLFPGLEITYTNGHGHYGAVSQDGELTYTLTMENHSEKDHEGIQVQIPVPTGSTLVSVCGESAKGSTVKRVVSLPAGQSVDLTYTVKPTGSAGSRIVAEGGYVHGIPLPVITTAVTSAAFTAEEVKQAAAAAAGKTGADFAEAVYAALGKEVELPAAEDLLSGMFKSLRMGETKVYTRLPQEELDETAKANLQMMIPDYLGGASIRTDADADEPRVHETRYHDLEVGDVVLFAQSLTLSEPVYGVFDGEFLLYPENGQVKGMLDFQYGKLLSYQFFVGLRPTQVL